MRWIETTTQDARKALRRLLERGAACPPEVEAAVHDIIATVRRRGDAALLRYTRQFDGWRPRAESLRVSPDEVEAAYAAVGKRDLAVLRQAARNIRRFHQRQGQRSWMMKAADGVRLGMRVAPIERVGVYVPGGQAAYPSSVLMNLIPAAVAEVPRRSMCVPAPQGRLNPYVLVAADLAGAHQVFKIGGAQAIAALAYGTRTVPRVDKIVGPGNLYVATAKRLVYGQVDIDMIAGPSEIVVVADSSASARYVAADLLSQAEHSGNEMAALLTPARGLAEAVRGELAGQLRRLPRRREAARSLSRFGALVVTRSLREAYELVNELAPEHVILAVRDTEEGLAAVRHAGAIFLGHYSPETIGDYMAGPNHVLPTNGTARFFSPLQVEQFQKKTSVIAYTREGLRRLAAPVMRFAEIEGLTAHAEAVRVRLSDSENL
ncbi:MAG: histidinol dehydrogenase [Candidatus Tectomicrobia bacterium]|nr:histidinol dehydrogenase [Candidatus Tectomicrobia bacterium]